MIFILSFIVLISGLIIGSFLNCVIYRLALPNFSFWKNLVRVKRSYCPHCKHTLVWVDLIPVFSFVSLRGECRYCHKKISIQYPIIEILTALIFLLIFLVTRDPAQPDNFINLIFLFYISSVLIIIFAYDLKHYIIPDKVLFPAIIITFLYQLIFNFKFLIFNSLWASFGAFTFFWFIFFISKEKWMGFGDCKLAILLGFLLGFPNIVSGIFLAFFFGAIIGIGLIFLNRRGLKSEIPFAPFLITGTFIAMFWGQEIINWYIHFLAF